MGKKQTNNITQGEKKESFQSSFIRVLIAASLYLQFVYSKCYSSFFFLFFGHTSCPFCVDDGLSAFCQCRSSAYTENKQLVISSYSFPLKLSYICAISSLLSLQKTMESFSFVSKTAVFHFVSCKFWYTTPLADTHTVHANINTENLCKDPLTTSWQYLDLL